METWKLLLITLLSAVVVGCIIGVLTGKHQIKKAKGDFKPLLSFKERIIYSLCIVVGAACILFGVFVAPGLGGGSGDMMLDEFGNPIMDGDMYGDDAMFGDYDDAMMQGDFDDGFMDGDEGFEANVEDGILVEGDPDNDVGNDEDDAEGSEDDAEDDEDAQDSADTQASTTGGSAAPAARPSGGGNSVRRSGGGGEVVDFVIVG